MYRCCTHFTVVCSFHQIFHRCDIIMPPYVIWNSTLLQNMFFGLYFTTATQTFLYRQSASSASVPPPFLYRQGVCTQPQPCPWNTLQLPDTSLQPIQLMDRQTGVQRDIQLALGWCRRPNFFPQLLLCNSYIIHSIFYKIPNIAWCQSYNSVLLGWHATKDRHPRLSCLSTFVTESAFALISLKHRTAENLIPTNTTR